MRLFVYKYTAMCIQRVAFGVNPAAKATRCFCMKGDQTWKQKVVHFLLKSQFLG